MLEEPHSFREPSMITARVVFWPLVLTSCLLVVPTHAGPPPLPGTCPSPEDIPQLCSMFSCRDVDCDVPGSESQLCCPITCNGVINGSRCADPVPFTTTTSTPSTTTTTPSTTTTTPSTTTTTTSTTTLTPSTTATTTSTTTTLTPSTTTTTTSTTTLTPSTTATTTSTTTTLTPSTTTTPIPTPSTTSPPTALTCANVLCQAQNPWCCLRRVACYAFPCPRHPECIRDPCLGDSCIGSGTCIRDCDLCENCNCISRNPCDTISCPSGTECDPRIRQCITVDICMTKPPCPRGSLCDPMTGICNSICHYVNYRYVSRSQLFCMCGPQEVCMGLHPDTIGSCCKPMDQPTSDTYKLTPTLLPNLLWATILYLVN